MAVNTSLPREEDYRRILEMSLDAIITADESGKIIFWNSSAERIFGYTKQEAGGLSVKQLMPEEYRQRHEEGLKRLITTGKPLLAGKVVEVKGLRKDQTVFPVEMSLSAAHEEKGWVFTSIIRDISERKEAERRLEAQNAIIQETNSELSILYKVSSAISQTIDLKQLLPRILATVTKFDVLKIAKGGGIFIRKGDRLELQAHLGHTDAFIKAHEGLKAGQCLCGIAAESGELIVSNDSCSDERHTIQYPGVTPHGHIIVPLKAEEKVLGVMYLYTPVNAVLDDQQKNLLIAIGSQLGIAINISMLYEETRSLSLKDPLTGAANKRLLDIELERGFARAKRYERPFSCLMMDIDFFKSYNDTYGHPAGDKVLKDAAGLCSSLLRETDLLIRYGGEEFLILLPETDLENALKVAEKIRKEIERSLPVTASFGASSITKEMAGSEALVDAADRALYKAKQNGRNRVNGA